MMNVRPSSVLAPLAASFSLLLAVFGVLMCAVAVIPRPEFESSWLRAAAFFSGAVALVPAISTSLMLRLQRIDAEFVNRSEEHTSELQSLMRISYAVLFLKKNNKKILTPNTL